MDEAAKVLGAKGEFAIITASLTAANMNGVAKVHRKNGALRISRNQNGRPASLR
jgi:hypothetical protein